MGTITVAATFRSPRRIARGEVGRCEQPGHPRTALRVRAMARTLNPEKLMLRRQSRATGKRPSVDGRYPLPATVRNPRRIARGEMEFLQVVGAYPEETSRAHRGALQLIW